MAGAAASTGGVAALRARLEWLDFYRGLAVLVMIETHVANTFLSTAHWPAEWRVNLNYVNGLVAPAFLFIAGYAHGLGLRHKRAVQAHIVPRLARLAGIAGIGYAMHFPVGALLRGPWAEAWRLGTQMDVLVCLAVSIAALVVIERVCGRAVNYGVSLAVVAVLALAPELETWRSGPVPLLAALNRSTGSLFPLLPWAAFVWCGFGASQRSTAWKSVLPLAGVCGAVVAWHGRADLTATSPAFFFERLGWVLLLVPVCVALSARWSPRLVLFAGRESLAVYLAHLALIELLALGGRNQLGLFASAALYLAVLAASLAIAHGWRTLSVARADRARRAAHLRESSARAA